MNKNTMLKVQRVLLALFSLFLLTSCQPSSTLPFSSEEIISSLPPASSTQTPNTSPKEFVRHWECYRYEEYAQKIANEYAYVFSHVDNFYPYDGYLSQLGEFSEFFAAVKETTGDQAASSKDDTWTVAYLPDTPREGSQYHLENYRYRLIAGNLYWTLSFDHSKGQWDTASVLTEEQWRNDIFSCNSSQTIAVRVEDRVRYCYNENRLEEVQFDVADWTVHLTELPEDYFSWYLDPGENLFFSKLLNPQRAMEAVQEFQNRTPSAPSEGTLLLSSLTQYQDFVKNTPLPKYFVSYENISNLGSFQWMRIENSSSSAPFTVYSYMLEKDGIPLLCSFRQQEDYPNREEDNSLYNRARKTFGYFLSSPFSENGFSRGFREEDMDKVAYFFNGKYYCRYLQGDGLALYRGDLYVKEENLPYQLNLVCWTLPLYCIDNQNLHTLFFTVSSSKLFDYRDNSEQPNFLMQLLEGEVLYSHQIKEYLGLS